MLESLVGFLTAHALVRAVDLFLLSRFALKFEYMHATRHGFTYSTYTWSSMNIFLLPIYY